MKNSLPVILQNLLKNFAESIEVKAKNFHLVDLFDASKSKLTVFSYNYYMCTITI
jgi:hypothetical protein